MIYENSHYKEITEAVEKGGGANLGIIIKEIILENVSRDVEMKNLWERYSGEVPILLRTFEDTTKPNNKIANDYRGLIVQQVVGYMFGNPIKYQIDPIIYADKIIEYSLALQSFLKRNNYEELDALTETYSAVCGTSYRLVYYADIFDATARAEEKIELIMKNIKPWETAVIRNPITNEPDYALIYYQFFVTNDKDEVVTVTRVEWYDRENVYYFITNEDGDYIDDYLVETTVQAHQFNFVPVIEFPNNALLKGDFEKIESIIDAMDVSTSDSVNELSTLANAYLGFFGAEPDADMLEKAKNTGAFYIPRNGPEDANNDVKFITKNINPQFNSEVINMLNDRIFKFGASVDMTDESFAGAAQTGVSRQYKMFALETKAQEKERYYTKSLRELFKVITSFWANVKSIQIEYEDISFIFSRYLPTDVTTTELIQMRGIVSDEAILHKLPSDVVPDVAIELERLRVQNEGNILGGLDGQTPDEPEV